MLNIKKEKEQAKEEESGSGKRKPYWMIQHFMLFLNQKIEHA